MAKLVSGFLMDAPSDVPSVTAPPGGPGFTTTKMIQTSVAWVTRTVCEPGLRTVNTGAECGSEADSYYFTPWRAPGSAPVLDACGMAGGAPSWGHHGAQYRASTHAKQGDRASLSLPQGVSGECGQSEGDILHLSQELTPGRLGPRSM